MKTNILRFGIIKVLKLKGWLSEIEVLRPTQANMTKIERC